jgi:hypothetical protein
LNVADDASWPVTVITVTPGGASAAAVTIADNPSPATFRERPDPVPGADQVGAFPPRAPGLPLESSGVAVTVVLPPGARFLFCICPVYNPSMTSGEALHDKYSEELANEELSTAPWSELPAPERTVWENLAHRIVNEQPERSSGSQRQQMLSEYPD